MRMSPPVRSLVAAPGSCAARLTAPVTRVLLAVALAAAASSGRADAPFSVTSLKELRERGVVMQKWETSCAAAALATVLTYGFGDPVSEEQVALGMLEHTQPARVRAQGGFSLLDMKRYASDRGYLGQALKGLALDDLLVLHAPIVPVSVAGFDHYVVVNGADGVHVLLADPAFGNRKMSRASFERAWLGGMAFILTAPAS